MDSRPRRSGINRRQKRRAQPGYITLSSAAAFKSIVASELHNLPTCRITITLLRGAFFSNRPLLAITTSKETGQAPAPSKAARQPREQKCGHGFFAVLAFKRLRLPPKDLGRDLAAGPRAR